MGSGKPSVGQVSAPSTGRRAGPALDQPVRGQCDQYPESDAGCRSGKQTDIEVGHLATSNDDPGRFGATNRDGHMRHERDRRAGRTSGRRSPWLGRRTGAHPSTTKADRAAPAGSYQWENSLQRRPGSRMMGRVTRGGVGDARRSAGRSVSAVWAAFGVPGAWVQHDDDGRDVCRARSAGGEGLSAGTPVRRRLWGRGFAFLSGAGLARVTQPRASRQQGDRRSRDLNVAAPRCTILTGARPPAAVSVVSPSGAFKLLGVAPPLPCAASTGSGSRRRRRVVARRTTLT